MKIYTFSQSFRKQIYAKDIDVYTDVGHKPSPKYPVMLWMIDRNGYISVKQSEKIDVPKDWKITAYQSHSSAFGKDRQKAVAIGRFDKNRGLLSALGFGVTRDDAHFKAWVENILKEKFGNFKLYWF